MTLRIWGLIGGMVFYALAVDHAFASDSTMAPGTQPGAPTGRIASELAATQPRDGGDLGLWRSPRPRPEVLALGADAGDPAQNDRCRWLGQRIVSLLSRDDAMTAKDFNPFYERFGCPTKHLAEAFGCVVGGGGRAQDDDLAIRVDRCWADPVEGRRPTNVVGDVKPAGDGRDERADGT